MAAHGAFYWMRAWVLLLCLTGVAPAASESDTSYYETLNVERSAAGSHIKKAFRKLAIKYHPDKNKSAGAEKTFREIVEAYTVLSNQEKRRLYDALGHKAFLENDAVAHPEDEHETSFPFGFEDFFHDFDDSPFMEEPFGHWTFPLNGGDEDDPFQHYIIEEPGYSFYFGDDEEEGPFF